MPPERGKGRGEGRCSVPHFAWARTEKSRVCLKPEDLSSTSFLTAAGPVEYSDILQLLPICEHIQMVATSIWDTFRKKVINSQPVLGQSSTKDQGGKPRMGLQCLLGVKAPLRITKSWLLSSPRRQKLFILEKNILDLSFSLAHLLCAFNSWIGHWRKEGSYKRRRLYAEYHLKGSETCMNQIHFHKKQLGNYNIVLYPKTGKKIYFQNVCLLKYPVWTSRKKNLETYGEGQVSFWELFMHLLNLVGYIHL